VGAAEDGGSSSSVLGGRPVRWQDVLPVLSLKQVEHLMARMGQVTEVSCIYATKPAKKRAAQICCFVLAALA
jgi:hypothetical protein